MRRRSGRRVRRQRLQQDSGSVPGIRRYLLCLRRNDACSDTDSDSIPLSSLLDADDDVTDTLGDCATTTLLDSEVGHINPTVCTGLMQVYSPYNDGAGIESMSDARCLIVHRMSMLHSAMPLFANHLQLPRFTGQRRWHTMFGQLSHLSSKGCGAGPMEISADEDVLADSNFASLFDSSTEQGATATAELPAPSYHDNHWASAGTMTTHGCQSRIGPRLSVNMDLLNETSLFPAASDDNVDSTNEFMRNAEVSMVDDSVNHGPMPAVSEAVLDVGCGDCVAQLSHERTEPSNVALQSLSSNGSSHPSRRSTTLHVRRRSDPGSLNSSTTTRSSSLSLSVSSSHNSAENWYYVDRRLRPGGELAAQYGRLRARRSLSMIVCPPAYDDIIHNPARTSTAAVAAQSTAATDEQLVTSVAARQSLAGDEALVMTELPPPPYQESERPPSYSDLNDRAADDVADNQSQPLTYRECSRDNQSASSNTYGEYSWQGHEYSQSPSHVQPRGDGSNMLMRQCSNSHRMFVGRPAVRWNRNTRIERWTSSSFNWVMS